MQLGTFPPKLDRQHEKVWVLLTFPTCTQLIPPPSDDIHCQVCKSPIDEHQMLLCDICNAGLLFVCLLPPLTTIPHGLWKCLYASHATSYPRQLLSTFAFLPPSSISTLIKILAKESTSKHSHPDYKHYNPQTLPPEFSGESLKPEIST